MSFCSHARVEQSAIKFIAKESEALIIFLHKMEINFASTPGIITNCLFRIFCSRHRLKLNLLRLKCALTLPL